MNEQGRNRGGNPKDYKRLNLNIINQTNHKGSIRKLLVLIQDQEPPPCFTKYGQPFGQDYYQRLEQARKTTTYIYTFGAN